MPLNLGRHKMQFRDLHNQIEPLLICNVWDVASAQAAEKLGFQAIGTSSAAIAKMLGYEDGEEMDFSELLNIVSRITANTKLPLTVDIEAGYSREPLEIANNIIELANLGVVGINIEDSIVESKRELINASAFKDCLVSIRRKLSEVNADVFVNARTDTFLLGLEEPIEETLNRIRIYENAGVDGLFIPCIEKEEDIQIIVSATSLPINVMCMPNLPDFKKLKEIGVKRISMGNFLFDKMYQQLESSLDSIVKSQSFSSVF